MRPNTARRTAGRDRYRSAVSMLTPRSYLLEEPDHLTDVLPDVIVYVTIYPAEEREKPIGYTVIDYLK